ncbi:hypothetical protein [Desulfovibrio sp. ZJ200]|nr:hypothetical protein [Desulfovibrio sp. ZJ200]
MKTATGYCDSQPTQPLSPERLAHFMSKTLQSILLLKISTAFTPARSM